MLRPIPLGTSTYVRATNEEAPIRLENRYFEQNPANQEDQVSLLARPGFKKWITVGASPINNVFYQPGSFNDAIFVASGGSLYRIDTNETVTTIGSGLNTTFGTVGKVCVRMVATARIGSTPAYLWIADGANLYKYAEGDATISSVSVPDGYGIIDLTFVSGYVIILVGEGYGVNGRFYWIDPGEVVIDPLNFATAERSPDPAYGLQPMEDQFWILGATSTEIWYPTGDFTTPFRRLDGRVFNRGVWPGSDVKVKDSIMIVDTDGVVYSISGSPQRVSTNAIEEQIRKSFASQRINGTVLRTWGFSLDGHDFYVITLPGTTTLVYDLSTEQWSTWKTPSYDYLTYHVGMNWEAAGATTYNRGQQTNVVAGDSRSGVLWLVDAALGYDQNITTGAAEAFTCKVTGGLEVRDRTTTSCPAVYLSASLGAPNITDAAVTLRTSDDVGQTWVNHGALTVAPTEYTQELAWRGLGLIRYPGKVFEISDSGASIRINGLAMR